MAGEGKKREKFHTHRAGKLDQENLYTGAAHLYPLLNRSYPPLGGMSIEKPYSASVESMGIFVNIFSASKPLRRLGAANAEKNTPA